MLSGLYYVTFFISLLFDWTYANGKWCLGCNKTHQFLLHQAPMHFQRYIIAWWSSGLENIQLIAVGTIRLEFQITHSWTGSRFHLNKVVFIWRKNMAYKHEWKTYNGDHSSFEIWKKNIQRRTSFVLFSVNSS